MTTQQTITDSMTGQDIARMRIRPQMITSQTVIGAIRRRIIAGMIAGDIRRVRPNSMSTQVIVSGTRDTREMGSMIARLRTIAGGIAGVRPNSMITQRFAGRNKSRSSTTSPAWTRGSPRHPRIGELKGGAAMGSP